MSPSDRVLRANLIRLASTYSVHSNERRQLLDLVRSAGEEQVPTPADFNDSATFPAADVAGERTGPEEQESDEPYMDEFTQQEHSELGDRVESNSIGNDARMANEFDPEDIAEEKSGPEEADSDESYMKGEFTQQENSEMLETQEKGNWGQVKAFLVRKAHAEPKLRKAVLEVIAGCEKLPAGGMRDNCMKKDKSNDKDDGKKDDGKKDDGKKDDKGGKGKMPAELLEKFKGKKAAGPDSRGRGWVEKQNPHRWLWNKDPDAPAFTVTEHDVPSGLHYKLQMLLPDGGMFKTHGQKLDKAHWFARAAKLYSAWGSAAGFDLSRQPERWGRMASSKKAKEGDQAEQDKMYAKGYRFIIRFQGNKIPPIYVKSPSQAAKLIREDYPNEKNYKSSPLVDPKGKKAAAAAAFKTARAEGKSNDECLVIARAAAALIE